LRAETGRIQKTVRQTEPNSSTAMAQAIPAQPAPAAEKSFEDNSSPVTTPIPWLNVQTLPEPIPFAQPAMQQKPPAQTQSDDTAASATSGSGVSERVIADSNATPADRAREPQRRQTAQARTEPPAPAIALLDHTFSLLMIMFVALAIAGPALHFVERRRRREAVNFRPPPWARVTAPNAPTPRIRVMTRPHIAKSLAPMPLRTPDQTERLAHALQQLVDRLQTADWYEPKTVRFRPRTSL
jgi:hypothetical protein